MKPRSRSGWTRPGKLRLPESTATGWHGACAPRFADRAGSGPELPMQVVQP